MPSPRSRCTAALGNNPWTLDTLGKASLGNFQSLEIASNFYSLLLTTNNQPILFHSDNDNNNYIPFFFLPNSQNYLIDLNSQFPLQPLNASPTQTTTLPTQNSKHQPAQHHAFHNNSARVVAL